MKNFENFNFELVKLIEKTQKHNMVIYVLFFSFFFEKIAFTLFEADEPLNSNSRLKAVWKDNIICKQGVF